MDQRKRSTLPIDSHVESILRAAEKHPTLLVRASPGSGKTTRLPWALTKLTQKKIIVLEPRRLAAKLAALRIAEEEGFAPGEEIGYHFRFEKKVSPRTRLTFYTEGTFLRLLGDDPELGDVGVVVLDEFHERHIETDLAFAYLRSLQERRRDLVLVVMSATLDTNLLPVFRDPVLFNIEARHFPVDVHYLENVPSVLNRPLETKIRDALRELTAPGDVLVFVPGMREMLSVRERIGEEFGEVHLLHADLSREEQERTLGRISRRKIILATNIAESSVTIPGIRIVIDSGIQREAQFSPWTGLKLLTDKPVTRSSAIQRTGRAGREAAGACYRLYSRQDYESREEFTVPEILKADLLDTVILTRDFPGELRWPSPPPPERWKKSVELATLLGLLDPHEKLTDLGKEVRRFPLDARLGRTLACAGELAPKDQKSLVRYIAQEIEGDQSGNIERRLLPLLPKSHGQSSWEKALLAGFVDQVARYRPRQNDFIHFSGKTLKAHRDLRELVHDFYLVLDVTARGEAIQVVPVLEEWLMDLEPFPFREDRVIDPEKLRLLTRTLLGSIVMDEAEKKLDFPSLTESEKEKFLELAASPFRKRLEALRSEARWEKLHFLARSRKLNLDEFVPDIGPFFEEGYGWEDFTGYVFTQLETRLEVTDLERLLPSKIDLGGRRELPIHYPLNLDPYVEAPIQDFYGQKSVPALLNGSWPLQLKLLGPHRRPIQVTKDLPGFWARMYPEMKKEWSREYPRHYWPEDPQNARPFLLKSHVKS